MNTTQKNIQQLDPERFAQWVQEVALINENMSETLRDAADALSDFDPFTAIRMYQAADAANLTAQHMRRSTPKGRWRADYFFGAGMLCGFIVQLANRFRRK